MLLIIWAKGSGECSVVMGPALSWLRQGRELKIWGLGRTSEDLLTLLATEPANPSLHLSLYHQLIHKTASWDFPVVQ